MGPGRSPSATSISSALGGATRLLGAAARAVVSRVRRSAITAPLDTGGFLGAAAGGWISTTPSLLPRTWWMWTANIGLSQIYGYATGATTSWVLRRAIDAIGLHVSILPERRRGARWGGAAALVGISAYSWVRGVLRQREISHLVQQEPKNLATHVVGTVGGVAASFAALVAVRAVIATADVYRALLRPVIPARALGALSLVLALVTAGCLAVRVFRHQLLERTIERAEATNRRISPDVPRPESTLRSGGPQSFESWKSLGAQGRRIVSGGADVAEISAAIEAPAREPIRVYAGTSSSRSMQQTVDAVVAELDRTNAWERGTIVLFTGTGTGWLQEWSLSAIEFLTGGDCATASLQYSVLGSPLSYLLDRRSPRQAGRQLHHAVSTRIARMPEPTRPKLFVAGESLGSYGGHGAFRDLAEMLRTVDGAVWTGTPRFTPIWREIEARSRPGAPAIAPVIDDGRNVRVVTRPRDLDRDYFGGPYATWEHPRVVYAQHASDPVAKWEPRLLWSSPAWLRERAGHDVTPAMSWYPWISFWQVSADMPLSVAVTGGHGHAYHEEVVPIWAAVLGQDAGEGDGPSRRRRHQRIVSAIRRVAPQG